MQLSVIIPAYNEEKRISSTLKSIDEYLRRQNYDYEILVVSDGSYDNTAGLVHGLEAEIRGLRLIDNDEALQKKLLGLGADGYLIKGSLMPKEIIDFVESLKVG